MTERMTARFAPLPAPPTGHSQAYFNDPIPKIIHQIWFGDPARMCTERTAQWRAFAERFGYNYYLWSEADVPMLAALMPADSFSLMQRLLACSQVHAASDIVRISLLRQFGGVYCDADMSPPSLNGEMVDLRAVMPMRGMVLMTENFGLNVGNSAMFFANGLMMASRAHPVYQHLERTLPENLHAVRGFYSDPAEPLCDIDAVYATGPGFLSRSLSGVFTTLPITYARRLGMVHDGKWDAESGVPFTFDEIGGAQAWQCRP